MYNGKTPKAPKPKPAPTPRTATPQTTSGIRPPNTRKKAKQKM